MENEKIDKKLSEVISLINSTFYPQSDSEVIKLYSVALTRDEIIKKVFEKYFMLKEGVSCCADKANYVLESTNKTLKTGKYISLQMTYGDYKKAGHNIGGITELNEICYWCPTTMKTTKDALEILFRILNLDEDMIIDIINCKLDIKEGKKHDREDR